MKSLRVLHDHRRDGLLWFGVCDGCMGAVWPHIEGARDAAERELVTRGWELVRGDMIRCPACVKRALEPVVRNRRGVRRRSR